MSGVRKLQRRRSRSCGQSPNTTVTGSLFGTAGTRPTTFAAFGSNADTTTTTAFGAQAAFAGNFTDISPFANQIQTAGTSISFNAILGYDTIIKYGAGAVVTTRYQSITAMKEYENQSLEELRLKDYQLNRKGPQNTMFGAQQSQAQPSGSFISGIGATSTSGTNTVGQTPVFGQTTNTGGLFGGLNQPKPGGFFGTGPTPATTAFGSGTGLGFSFSNPTSQPQTRPAVNATLRDPPLAGFGSANAAPTFGSGTGGLFSNDQQQQSNQPTFSFARAPISTCQATTQPVFGTFSGTRPTPTTGFGSGSGLGFSFSNPTSQPETRPPVNSTLRNPPLAGFGSANPAPTFGSGTGGLFANDQQQQPKKPTFSFARAPISTCQATTQPVFGTPIYSVSNIVSTPASGFVSNTGAESTFGTGMVTGSAVRHPFFRLGTTQEEQPGAGPPVDTSCFSSGANTTTCNGNTDLSQSNTPATGTNLEVGGLQQQQQLQMQPEHPQVGTISFDTIPIDDIQLALRKIIEFTESDHTQKN